ncbi:hypothetical protein [Rhodococcus ruber]
MYVLFGFPIESPIAAKRADNGTIRLEFGLQGHLSLTNNEAAALVARPFS